MGGIAIPHCYLQTRRLEVIELTLVGKYSIVIVWRKSKVSRVTDTSLQTERLEAAPWRQRRP